LLKKLSESKEIAQKNPPHGNQRKTHAEDIKKNQIIIVFFFFSLHLS
jgi:hypothetical protein